MHFAPLFRFATRPGSALLLALVCAGFEEDGFEFYIPYVPTPQAIVERMLDMAQVGETDFLIDLGSGDGRIPITAARRHGARALGVEIKPELVRLADRLAAEAGVSDKVTFREQDLYRTPLGDASVVTLYLPPSVNLKLRPRLLRELRPGARIVSQSYHLGGWLADERDSVRGIDVYLWIVPARVAGHWELDDGRRRLRLTLEQKFQEVNGTATFAGEVIAVRGAKLRGDRLDFALVHDDRNVAEFSGIVAGDTIQGRAGTSAWTARRVAPAPRAGK
jgi:hypothetical protein